MESLSYQNIKPLLQSAQQEGHYLRCDFVCPVTQFKVQARAKMEHGDVTNKLADSAKRGAWSSLKWRIAHAVRSAMGYGVLGSTAGHVVREMLDDAGEQQTFSEEDRQRAIVQAFSDVQSLFFWEDRANRWIAAQAAGDLLTEFARQLSEAPVAQPYDRGVMVRMLVECAAADGTLAEEERSFLGNFVTPDQGSVEELARKPPLSVAELSECSAGPVRDTMLMLAWAVALADRSLDAEELTRLNGFAQGLGIADGRAQQLKMFAQKYLVDQALEQAYADDKRDEAAYNDAMQLAQDIGLDSTEAQRVDIRLRKRKGIA